MSTQLQETFALELLGPDDFRVFQRQDGQLLAVLGCGLGIALIDRGAGVGGMLHLLGKALESTESCEGMLDRFLDELESNGARSEHLEGLITGGAELGGVSLSLSEEPGTLLSSRLLELLRQRQLPPLSWETGGNRGYRLELDMESLDFRSSLIHTEPEAELVDPRAADSAFCLQDALQQIKPIPQIALETLAILANDSYSMKELAACVHKDQVITARVLGWCNAAGVVGGHEVSNLDAALVRMGEKKLIRLILAATLSGYFVDQDTGYAQSRGGLFHGALACAAITSELAHLLAPELSRIAYTAGLLHDIGKVVLDHHVCRVAPEFYRVLRDEQSLLAAEAKVIGITHPEAGEKLALEWELAEPLVQAVRWHHEPRKATEHGDLCTLVCLSDWLSRILWEGQQPWMAQEMELTTLLARFGMSPNALPTLLSALPLREIHRQVMLS